LVTASKDEGFGIPLVEAMQKGLPVVVSNLEIFREVAGDAGLFFDPNNPQDLAEKLIQLDSKATWEARSASGIKQAKNFNWDKSADELLKSFSQPKS
jgi:glycosyltransferase involved in cell wall biosynthesis